MRFVVGLEHLAARGLDLTLRFAPLEELIAAAREAPPEVEQKRVDVRRRRGETREELSQLVVHT